MVSSDESRMRGSVNLKKCWQATMYTARLTNLKLLANLSLDINSMSDNGLLRSWLLIRIYWESLTTDRLYDVESSYKEQEPKYIIDEGFGTMGNPKYRKVYGCGGSISGLRLRLFSSNTGIIGKNIPSPCASILELTRLSKVNQIICHLVSMLLLWFVVRVCLTFNFFIFSIV